MTRKMLIDAVHPEEIRVAITENNRIEDFDFEVASRRPIKGNIYLAKVTRVEPSLQAAFVEYGGNRQGFLPFSEIHYDYFQIPVEDKKKLEQELEKEKQQAEKNVDDEENGIDEPDDKESGRDEEKGRVPFSFYRKYKIQEVIKRNQIILVQIIKEERGNKGASITTFISLPGKYCVFMPKTDNQGGVSRKISDFDARRKMRKIVREVETPKGASIIVRTAGADRTKAEIKRDFSYLNKLWEKIRDNAIKSSAPALIYEEGDIIKRSIRDMYDSSIEEVIVEGEAGYKDAKNFMTLITPSHSKKVKQHKKTDPIFWEYEIEDDLSQLYDVEVPLKSGGYIVLNPTEALVSIDVNSGKATRERSVEETALKTNIEAAKEIARQLKLRDLSGLIVIDFIDMLQLRNKKTVERALKDALRKDRARIQVGRISIFGLLEMSRQRLGSSVVEASTVKCPRCNGLGRVRSKHSSSVTLLREVEHEAKTSDKKKEITAFTSEELSAYMKKEKKDELKRIEKDSGVKVNIKGEKKLTGAQFAIAEDALKELLEAIAEHEQAREVQEEKLAMIAETPTAAVHQDDVEESEIGVFEDEDGDLDDNEAEDDTDFRPRPRRRNQGGGRHNSNRRDSRRGGSNNRGKRDDNRRGGKPGGPRKSNDNRPRGGGGNRRPTKSDVDGNVGNVADMPTEKRRTSEDPEKDKSVIKNLWKKITD